MSFLSLLLENLVLISHTIPMSIYVAIEVLKWFQVRLVLSDEDLMKDPGNIDNSLAALDVGSSEEKIRERKQRNMVRIPNTEVIENLG